MKQVYVADFETTTNPQDCRVWGWGLYDIYSDVFGYGTTIENFFNEIFKLPSKSKIYFHNLKFDGEFMFYYLFENGFKHTTERKLENKEFSTLITHMGVFYAINVKYKGREYQIYDSLKIIPLPVKKISKAFGIEQLKGDIDYLKERPKDYELTEKEIAYIKNDVEIVGKALLYFFEQNLGKMTQASNAFYDFKSIMGRKKFEKLFPVIECDSEIRQSYKGGFTYVQPKYQNKEIGEGIVLDVNSLYPSVMYNDFLPYGEPIYFDGKYEKDKLYNLHVQMFRCNFEIKENHLPTIQLKNNMVFMPTEYVESSKGLDVTLCLTSVDLELFLKHYEVYNVEWFGGWKFKSTNILFRDYIDKWSKIKIESSKNGNEGLRSIAKLMLNALYGKFGLNPKVKSKIPNFHDGQVVYTTGEEEKREPVYIPVASFITSYARKITIESAQKNYNRFLYADTDSLHLIGLEEPKNIDIDPVKLGAWKIEGKFNKAKYIRAKSYIENMFISVDEFEQLKESKKKNWTFNKELNVYEHLETACAGLPKKAQHLINFDNFKSGLKLEKAKLQHKRVKGGVILNEVDFTIKI